MMREQIRLETTKSGLPGMWESGGGATNTGGCRIIAGKNGEPRRPIYVRRSGSLACSEHALIVVEVGFYIVVADHHRQDFAVNVKKIVGISKSADGHHQAEVELVNEFSRGEWNVPLAAELEAAVSAAYQKAVCYHCREPHFVLL